ncbi:D-tagatose-bisphosphate aldolase, class II, non-catalytic subunit [Mycolicibacterium litorale]|nr:D-tagatose-bisphosphate aldolase, class II, non-catalytic subunit [Mycolicibacterium litorale]
MSGVALDNPFAETICRHKAGRPVGVYSVCSADPTVIRAALEQAVADGTYALIEATSNQVDQFGGYTGMRPDDFRDMTFDLAGGVGLPQDRVVLGGDHLGPNRWQDRPAEEAMANAEVLVAAYVESGYTKIHLDCSMRCADDPAVIDDGIVAARATRLLGVAETAAARVGTTDAVRYVIGTEVPVPGGAHESLDRVVPTAPSDVRQTIAAHREAFAAAELDHVWPRVAALVVQPGVEFDHLKVVDYHRSAAAELSRELDAEPNLVFEAHSTDYQRPQQLRELVEDHWAILKVGPGLTFALREALFALARIEEELVAPDNRSNLVDVVERRMVAEPGYWLGYYDGGPAEQRIARRYSYSDRLRYYWADPAVKAARATLLANLSTAAIPLPLVSQFLPDQYHRIRDGRLGAQPHALVIDRIRDALRPYAAACVTTVTE